MPELKAEALIDKHGIQKVALQPYQWWERSESGKRWELWWKDGKGLLHRLTYINSKNVLWVIPIKEQEGGKNNDEIHTGTMDHL